MFLLFSVLSFAAASMHHAFGFIHTVLGVWHTNHQPALQLQPSLHCPNASELVAGGIVSYRIVEVHRSVVLVHETTWRIDRRAERTDDGALGCVPGKYTRTAVGLLYDVQAKSGSRTQHEGGRNGSTFDRPRSGRTWFAYCYRPIRTDGPPMQSAAFNTREAGRRERRMDGRLKNPEFIANLSRCHTTRICKWRSKPSGRRVERGALGGVHSISSRQSMVDSETTSLA
jgi:hypothetical protein